MKVVADKPHGHARVEFLPVADQQRDSPEHAVGIRLHADKADAACCAGQIIPCQKGCAGFVKIADVLCIECPRCRVEEMNDLGGYRLSINGRILQTKSHGIIRLSECLR